MKKRSIGCFLLAIILVMQIIPMTSIHAAEGEYGSVPILTGYMDVDYMASVVLSEIKTDGLSNRNKIQAVYDWIIAHCKRNNWDGTYYFDPQEVETHLDAYWQSVNLLLQQKKVVLRPECPHPVGIFHPNRTKETLSRARNPDRHRQTQRIHPFAITHRLRHRFAGDVCTIRHSTGRITAPTFRRSCESRLLGTLIRTPASDTARTMVRGRDCGRCIRNGMIRKYDDGVFYKIRSIINFDPSTCLQKSFVSTPPPHAAGVKVNSPK